ncbi:DASS family sodium-coupled anion symporter [Methanocaldococcus fervens]|uniref:Anion transporter n=1 Tax=Methanocaldococcus fervens (strain DSM 4213 / JCM 15782 / AG86) TaxID=573064 RepID=C7P7B6_METFA|nr:DASS family sodium-coupled anion symporter [Methanocaldococcus fervens]ACV24448.1 anion transporter [Methanocaldococcus fervens AG86]
MGLSKEFVGLGMIILLTIFVTTLPDIYKGIVILMVVGCLWFFELLPLPVTSLAIPIMAVFSGIFDLKEALTYFAHPIIFLFLGGFIIAQALKNHNLDKFIAYKLLNYGKDLKTTCFLMFLSAYFLSMWISNTSATLILLPIALGLIYKKSHKLKDFLLLGIAYSASIGGIATIIGSPPNAISSSYLNYGFFSWFKVGFPISLLLFLISTLTLYLYFKKWIPNEDIAVKANVELSKKANKVLIIFLLVAFLWIFSDYLSEVFDIKYFDSIIAIFAIILLFVFNLVEVSDFKKVDWGTLILFGGALCLGGVVAESGASAFLAEKLVAVLGGFSPIIIIFTIISTTIILTNFISNTGLAGVLIPILFGAPLGIPEEILILAIGISASCSFILPVGTPPNAIVYGEGIKKEEMIKIGTILSVLSATVITLYFTFYL